MTKRYLVGGPSNSGKSTLILSLIKRINDAGKQTAESIELDVWSRSYPAFRGEIPFKGRPKTVGLDWDWQTPLLAELERFNTSEADVVFGDLPGAAIDEATDFMCDHAKADGAIVISRLTDGLEKQMEGIKKPVPGLEAWCEFFGKRGVPVVHRFLTFAEAGDRPTLLYGLDRNIDAKSVAAATAHIMLLDLIK